MPETGIDPLIDSLQVVPGDLCRATLRDDPAVMATWMHQWFGNDNPATVAAVSWLREIADALEDADG